MDYKVLASSDLKIHNSLIYGDILEIQNPSSEPKEVTGTIIGALYSQRDFLPGDYKFTILQHDASYKCGTIMLTRSDVSTDKIHNYLYNCNIWDNFRLKNRINRYDWLHNIWWCDFQEIRNGTAETNDLSESEKFVYDLIREHGAPEKYFKSLWLLNRKLEKDEFTKLEVKNLLKGADEVYVEGEKVGFLIQVNEFAHEWFYGCMFQDKTTDKCFGFVGESFYFNKVEEGSEEFDINKDKYIFDVKQFMIE